MAILPPKAPGGPAIAYLLSSRIKMDELPLGGHYSIEVSDDGRVGPIRKFTNGCVNSPLNAGLKGKEGAKVAGLSITHLLDPTPTEIHVFSSMTAKLPIFVLTTQNQRLWNVNGSRVTFQESLPRRP